MFDLIATLTMARIPKPSTKVDIQELKAAAPAEPSGSGTDRFPIFTNPKAIQFPILVGLVKGAWLAAKALPPASTAEVWLTSVWFPFAFSIFLGLLIAISNLIDEKPTIIGWIFGLAVGFLNSMVVFGAVMGIPK
jgi:hypothetical protein